MKRLVFSLLVISFFVGITPQTQAQNIVLKDLRIMMTPDTIIKIDTNLTLVRNLTKRPQVNYKLAFKLFGGNAIDQVKLRIENPNNGNVVFTKTVSYADFNIKPLLRRNGAFHIVELGDHPFRPNLICSVEAIPKSTKSSSVVSSISFQK